MLGDIQITEILNPFLVNLARAQERFGYFMEYDVTPHTAKATIRALRGVFGEINGEDRITSKGRPPRSQDPNPVIFICGENSKVLCMSTIRMTWRL
jgi:hypothetical protein